MISFSKKTNKTGLCYIKERNPVSLRKNDLKSLPDLLKYFFLHYIMNFTIVLMPKQNGYGFSFHLNIIHL